MSIHERVRDYLISAQPQMVAFLEQLVCAESPSRLPETQDKPLTLLFEALYALNYDVQRIPGQKTGGHLVAQPRDWLPDRPRQLLLGHCDTVWPLGTLREMPFVVDGNVARGPGVYDMKGGLVQLLFALKAIHELGLETAVSPAIFINSDEEMGSPESRDHIQQLAPHMDRVFVMEPALGPSGKLKTARKGVGRFTVTIEGKPAHAGLEPEKGVSAILELSHVVQKLFALNEPQYGISVNVGMVEGGVQANVIAPVSKALVDVRVSTEADAQRMQVAIEGIQPTNPDVTLQIEGGFGRPPLERTPRNRVLWQAAQKTGAELGMTLEEGVAGGGSDGNLTSPFTATLDGLGAIGDGAHASHEFIYLDKMVERSQLLVHLLLLPVLPMPKRSWLRA